MPRSIFVAVLDWGLGHATRCIPVINELLKQNFKVIIGGSGPSLNLLKREFSDLTFYDLPSYGIVYSKNGSLAISIFLQIPKTLLRIKREKKTLDQIIKKENIECIISDNRYGCFSKKIKSVLICHQLNLQMPLGLSFLSGIINWLHLRQIKNFNEVWVPDEREGIQFSGLLSQNKLKNVRYTGILSRFGNSNKSHADQYDIVALVSGPEPQRTEFENLLHDQLIHVKQKSLLVNGKPGSMAKTQSGSLTQVDHTDSKDLESILMQTSMVICRSGYSTIMDLLTLGKAVVFVPTPGQTEQEYLATYFVSLGLACCQDQNKFNLDDVLSNAKSITNLPITRPNSHLKEVIESL